MTREINKKYTLEALFSELKIQTFNIYSENVHYRITLDKIKQELENFKKVDYNEDNLIKFENKIEEIING